MYLEYLESFCSLVQGYAHDTTKFRSRESGVSWGESKVGQGKRQGVADLDPTCPAQFEKVFEGKVRDTPLCRGPQSLGCRCSGFKLRNTIATYKQMWMREGSCIDP